MMYKSEISGKGGIYAKVVCDSIANGVRLTTFELRYPRFILAELNTHRMFSRNSSSSRAIPVKTMIEQVDNDPAMPIHWGKNQPGMQANEECNEGIRSAIAKILKIEIAGDFKQSREDSWEVAAGLAIASAEVFSEAGYHKQIVNRLLEPFQFMKTVVTATEWENFFHLRDHKDAQPEIAELAQCMKKAMEQSKPRTLFSDEWHTPYVTFGGVFTMSCFATRADLNEAMVKASAARCARVSYLNHDKSSPSIEDDLKLYNMLATRPYDDGKGHVLGKDDPVHLSPLEHQATPMMYPEWELLEGFDWESGVTHIDVDRHKWSGNFKAWVQYRQTIGGN